MKRHLDLVARCAIGVLLIVIGIRVATSRAPAAAAETPVPASTSAAPMTSSGTAPIASAEEVAIRLTERLPDARLEMPQMARGLTELELHWRRMQAPWIFSKPSPVTKLVQQIALRTSATEVAHTVTTKEGATKTFDVRKWNMHEGSYSQREAIVAPTPATIRMRLKVPLHASLEVSPGVLGIGEAAATGPAAEVTFVVRALPAGGGEPIEVGRATVGVGERNRWKEHRFDLGPFGGKEIDLELLTDAAIKKDFPGAAGLPTPMVLALWGTPQIVRRGPPRLPYSILWIVVDALRPDVIASFRDDARDAKKRAAKHPPGDTLLPKIPGITPVIDALAKRGTIYRDAISAAPWTRPGTLAMLSGVHSRQLGLSPLPWMLMDAQLDAYYGSKPPLLSLAMRRAGAATRAVVNNNFMLGYAQVGVDMGFESVDDHRYRTRDTAEVTKNALEVMRAHRGERTFLFVNYNSPHEPFDPTPECLARVPGPEGGGPKDDSVQRYMAEACKDDAAIGELLAELDASGERERTLIVVTADHGETLAEHHEMIAEGLDKNNTRFHHAFGMFEETTRIPILLSLPKVIPEDAKVDARVTNLDLAPTILALEGLEPDPRHQGIDLVALARGQKSPERPIVTLGRASAAIFWKNLRYVVRDDEAQKVLVGRGDNAKTMIIRHELYDLDDDPGEEHNLANVPAFSSTVAEMKARLAAATAGVPTADAIEPASKDAPPLVRVRFAGANGLHRVQATIVARNAKRFVATPVGIPPEAIHVKHGEGIETIDVATTTAQTALLGFDLLVVPPTTALTWTFTLDDKPLGDEAVFGGFLGVAVTGLSKGIVDATMRAAISAAALPFIDPTLDLGVFVTRDWGAGEGLAIERVKGGAAASEVQNALKQWGYAK